MTRNVHGEARELIALGSGLGDEQQTWLRGHLQECRACADFSEAAIQAVHALRSQPFAADSALVRMTQMRVRARVYELRQQQERAWLVTAACLLVGISAAIMTPLSWRAFAWLGEWASVSNWVWQAGFAIFCIVPALVVSALLMARGTHLTSTSEGQWT